MLNFILNRCAGNNSAKKTFSKIKDYLNKNKIIYRVFYSIDRPQIKEIVASLEKDKEDNIIVVGGDGTIHDVVNAVTNLNKINIGIIPAGQDNNFAKSLGLHLEPVEALKDILNNEIIKVDLMNIGGMKAINSVVVSGDYFLKMRKGQHENSKAYNYNLQKILNKARTFTLNKTLEDNKTSESEINLALICNGKYVCGDIKYIDEASLTDNKLNYIEFKKSDLKLKFKNKTLVREESSGFNCFEIKKIKLTSGEENFDFLVDGELVTDTICEVTLTKNALLTFKPRDTSKKEK